MDRITKVYRFIFTGLVLFVWGFMPFYLQICLYLGKEMKISDKGVLYLSFSIVVSVVLLLIGVAKFYEGFILIGFLLLCPVALGAAYGIVGFVLCLFTYPDALPDAKFMGVVIVSGIFAISFVKYGFAINSKQSSCADFKEGLKLITNSNIYMKVVTTLSIIALLAGLILPILDRAFILATPLLILAVGMQFRALKRPNHQKALLSTMCYFLYLAASQIALFKNYEYAYGFRFSNNAYLITPIIKAAYFSLLESLTYVKIAVSPGDEVKTD